MTTQEEVREIAKKVRESANDLRLLEVVGAWIDAGDVDKDGDSGADRYKDFAGASGDRVKYVQSQQSAQLGTEFDWIIGYYEFYAHISEKPYQGMNNALQSVLSGFATNAVSYKDDIQSRFDLGDWDGKYAEALNDNLISPLDDVPYNQAHIVRELQAAVLGHWNLVLATRKAALAIGTATKASLDARIARAAGPDLSGAVMPVIGAALAIVGVFAALPTDGASLALLPLSLGILGAARATTDAAIKIHEELNQSNVTTKPVTIQGSTSADIINSMIEELSKLDQLVADEEKKLSDKLDKSITEVDAWLKDTKGGNGRKPRAWHLQSFRSELADGQPSHDKFDHVDQ
ncbi:MAG TPA: hypothetical protein VE172_20865 [Stackebrandtia sp.]|uniref:hypothetical protein n=1 Tax=Stackebrandtia sp. TaxID=2023065 RepID=UPI002D3B920C|nr:hypothetical protein [Stackebrandtia sp.]HZE41260.1 hypothetical protein [Stackebrandtia sp.]